MPGTLITSNLTLEELSVHYLGHDDRLASLDHRQGPAFGPGAGQPHPGAEPRGRQLERFSGKWHGVSGQVEDLIHGE